MKAVRLFEHGGPSVLKYIDEDVPQIGVEDVLIRVHATSINNFDIRFREGTLPRNPIPGRPAWGALPFQLGRDAAGEIVAVGSNVQRWKIGDRVVQMVAPACGKCPLCLRQRENLCTNIAYPGHQVFGGYAQFVARRQDAILPIADHVSYELAAATLWAYTTPFGCNQRRAPARLGDSVMITGASGGLAIAAMQLAKLSGATVIGTTTKPQRREALLTLGYDYIVNSTDPDMPKVVKQLTGGLGADVVWETIGGSQFLALSLASLRVGGTIAIIAAPTDHADNKVEIIPGTIFLFLELNLMGVRGATRLDQELVMKLLAQGKIKPVIDRTFPLSAAAQAHEYLQSQRAVGKIVLLPQEN